MSLPFFSTFRKRTVSRAVADKLLRFGLVTGLAWPVAIAWRLLVRPWKSSKGEGSGKKRPRLLALSRKIGDNDLRAIAEATPELEIWVLPKGCVVPLCFRTLKVDPEADQVHEQNYHTDDLAETGRKAYRDRLHAIFRWWWKFGWKFDGFFASNFGYLIHQEWVSVGKDLGYATFVLHKEGLTVPGRWEELVSLSVGKRFPDYALYYNEGVRQAMLKHVFPGTEDYCETVGIPRLDRYFDLAPTENEQHFTFFSFYPRDKFFYLNETEELKEEAMQKGLEFHREVIRTFARRPGSRLTIKTKKPDRYLRYVQEIVEELKAELGDTSLQRITVTNDGNPFDLIASSNGVIGLSSTTLIEALIAYRPIFSADFRGMFGGKSEFFEDYPGLVEYGDDSQAVNDWVQRCEDGRKSDDTRQRENFLTTMIHVPDGRAGARAGQAILRVMRNPEYLKLSPLRQESVSGQKISERNEEPDSVADPEV